MTVRFEAIGIGVSNLAISEVPRLLFKLEFFTIEEVQFFFCPRNPRGHEKTTACMVTDCRLRRFRFAVSSDQNDRQFANYFEAAKASLFFRRSSMMSS